LTEASNVSGAAAKQTAVPNQNTASAQASIIIVEVIGYGGGSGDLPDNSEEQRRRGTEGQRTYDTNSPFQVVGAGSLNQAADRYLTEEEKRALRQQDKR